MTRSHTQQQGMVLLMVLLIFSVVAVLATSMIDRQSIDIERSQTLFTQQQARLYAFGAESATRSGLYMDWEADAAIDHAMEEWTVERTFPLDPGIINIRIQDAQGRFNLNSLLPGGTSAVHEQRFKNLLSLLGLEPVIASDWAKWLNKESNVDNKYLSMEPSYRPAYRACKHTSELMLIEGVDLTAYAKLEPYIACLPASAQLNVNTAADFVLASIDSRLTLSDAEQLIAERGQAGFKSVQDFMGSSVLSKLKNDNEGSTESAGNEEQTSLVETDFSVTTEFFEMFALIDLNDRIGTVEALIYRNIADGSMATVRRDFSRRAAREAW